MSHKAVSIKSDNFKTLFPLWTNLALPVDEIVVETSNTFPNFFLIFESIDAWIYFPSKMEINEMTVSIIVYLFK